MKRIGRWPDVTLPNSIENDLRTAAITDETAIPRPASSRTPNASSSTPSSTSPSTSASPPAPPPPCVPTPDAPRRRLALAEREAQIVAGAIAFFSRHGLDGQMRVLANEVGVTHALLYHYFPTKQALIERVYYELCEGRWKAEWEALLDDPARDVEDKFNAFYGDYSATVLTRDFVRVFMFSGLSDRYITDRFFTLLRTRLFPRLIRETRRHCGIVSRRKPSTQELELLMGLHGGIFYTGVRRYIYEQAAPTQSPQTQDEDLTLIRDRVRGYLLAARGIMCEPVGKTTADKPTKKNQSMPSKTARRNATNASPANDAAPEPAAKRVLKGR